MLALAFVAGLFAIPSHPADPSTAPADEAPKVGALAPDFLLIDQDGRYITRDSLRGKRVLLAFYPKDFTPG